MCIRDSYISEDNGYPYHPIPCDISEIGEDMFFIKFYIIDNIEFLTHIDRPNRHYDSIPSTYEYRDCSSDEEKYEKYR